ncbi:MAG: hypothetical protein QM564_11615 [Bergeyella sp.]
MNTKEKFKIKTSEVAQALGWNYTTTDSIRRRKSPVKRYEKYLEAEKKLIEAKQKISEELTKN